MKSWIQSAWLVLLVLVVSPFAMAGDRLKDIATLKGVRENPVWGYGLVVGLAGTGDREVDFTEQSLNLLLKRMGVDIKKTLRTKNAAAVMVSATVAPFTGVGSQIDVRVSSLGSASSLENGTLLMTPLQGADGSVYAIAQGPVVVSRPKRARGQRSSQRRNAVIGVVRQGAIVEKKIPLELDRNREMTFLLSKPDFTTAARVAHAINEELGTDNAKARGAGEVHVDFPQGFTGNSVELVARLESIEVESDSISKVVINRTTGTVVLGELVKINPVAIAHNNLHIEITKPAPVLDPNESVQNVGTVAPPSTGAQARDVSSVSPSDEEKKIKRHVMLVGGATVADVVASLNELGATAEDLVQLLESLKASGALVADIEFQS